MNRNIVALAATLAALGLSAPAAFAKAEASAQISNITFQLIDLRPGDGIAPAITFAPGSVESVNGNANDSQTPLSLGFNQTKQSFAPLSRSSVTPKAEVEASEGPHGASANGWATGPVPVPYFSNSFNANATLLNNVSFTLTPYTEVILHANASVTSQTTLGYDPDTGASENASAYASISFWGVGASGRGNQSSSDQLNVNASWTSVYDPTTGTYVYTGQSFSDSGELVASFLNYTSSTLSGTTSITASLGGSSSLTDTLNTAPIPEPSTAMLMLPGLALVGFGLRRRARKG